MTRAIEESKGPLFPELKMPARPRAAEPLTLPELPSRKNDRFRGAIAEIAGIGIPPPLSIPQVEGSTRVEQRDPLHAEPIPLASIPAPQLVRMLNSLGVLDRLYEAVVIMNPQDSFRDLTRGQFKDTLQRFDPRELHQLITENEPFFADSPQNNLAQLKQLVESPRFARTAKLLSESFRGMPGAENPFWESFQLHHQLGSRKMIQTNEQGENRPLDESAIHELLLNSDFIAFQERLHRRQIRPNDQILDVIEAYCGDANSSFLNSKLCDLTLGLLRSHLPGLMTGKFEDVQIAGEIVSDAIKSQRTWHEERETEVSLKTLYENASIDDIARSISSLGDVINFLRTFYGVPTQKDDLFFIIRDRQHTLEHLEDPDIIALYSVIRKAFPSRLTYSSYKQFSDGENGFLEAEIPFLQSFSSQKITKEELPVIEEFLKIFQRSLAEFPPHSVFQGDSEMVAKRLSELRRDSEFRQFIADKLKDFSAPQVQSPKIAEWTIEFLTRKLERTGDTPSEQQK